MTTVKASLSCDHVQVVGEVCSVRRPVNQDASGGEGGGGQEEPKKIEWGGAYPVKGMGDLEPKR